MTTLAPAVLPCLRRRCRYHTEREAEREMVKNRCPQGGINKQQFLGTLKYQKIRDTLELPLIYLVILSQRFSRKKNLGEGKNGTILRTDEEILVRIRDAAASFRRPLSVYSKHSILQFRVTRNKL